MRGMNTKLVAATVVIGLCAGLSMTSSALASEDPIVHTVSIGLTKTEINTGMSFPKFDSALGHLDSVTLTLAGRGDTSVTFTVDTATTSMSIGTQVNVAVMDPGGHFAAVNGDGDIVPVTTANPQFSLLKTKSFQKLLVGKPYSTGTLTFQRDGSEVTYADAATLAEFTGLGDIVLNFATLTQTALVYTGGNVTANQTTHVGLDATVTYEYSAVPEATTMLMGLAAGVPVMMHRRRAKKTA